MELQRMQLEFHVPGAAVALSFGNGEIATVCSGLAGVRSGTRVDEETRFYVGSISKQFTAVAILRLAEQGALALDDSIRQHVTGLRAEFEPVTLRSLLTHTSGLPDALDALLVHIPPRTPLLRATAVRVLNRSALDARPGTQWVYRNAGYYLLGLAVERVSGVTYHDYIWNQVIRPAELDHTGLAETGHAGLSDGHEVIGNRSFPVMLPHASHTLGSGGIVMSAADMVRWRRALASGRVITARSQALMETGAQLSDGEPAGYGMGWYVTPQERGVELSHDGASGGFSCQLASYPTLGFDIAIAMNVNTHIAELIEKRISKCLAQGPGNETGMGGDVPARNPRSWSVTELCGDYRLGSTILPIWSHDNGLRVRHPHGRLIRLRHVQSNEFLDTADEATVFTFHGGSDQIQCCGISRFGKQLATLMRD